MTLVKLRDCVHADLDVRFPEACNHAGSAPVSRERKCRKALSVSTLQSILGTMLAGKLQVLLRSGANFGIWGSGSLQALGACGLSSNLSFPMMLGLSGLMRF